jgi:hypothetical protein
MPRQEHGYTIEGAGLRSSTALASQCRQGQRLRRAAARMGGRLPRPSPSGAGTRKRSRLPRLSGVVRRIARP